MEWLNLLRMENSYHRSHSHGMGTSLGSTQGGINLEPKIIITDVWGKLN